MELYELAGYLGRCGADVVAVGAAVAALDFAAKKLLKGRLSAKCVVFLPFLLGVALYFAYGALFIGDTAQNAALFVRSGFSCGSFATAAKVILSQFFTKGTLSDRQTLRSECVKQLLAPYKALTDEEAAGIASLAETDELRAKELIRSLCEDAPDPAAEIVLGALRAV